MTRLECEQVERADGRRRGAARRRQRRTCGAPPVTLPSAPGPKPSHALPSRRAERRAFRTRWRGAGPRGMRVRVRRRSAVSNCRCSVESERTLDARRPVLVIVKQCEPSSQA